MRIKIIEENAAKIEKILAEINGRSREHVFNFYREISDVAEKAEHYLRKIEIPQTRRKGATAWASSSCKMPSAYSYPRNGNSLRIERGGSAWFLVSIKAASLYQSDGGGFQLSLTDAQIKKAILAFAKENHFAFCASGLFSAKKEIDFSGLDDGCAVDEDYWRTKQDQIGKTS